MEGRRPSGEWMPIVQRRLARSPPRRSARPHRRVRAPGSRPSRCRRSRSHGRAAVSPAARCCSTGRRLLDLSLEEKRGMRGRRVAYIAQSAAAAFNIAHTLGDPRSPKARSVHATMSAGRGGSADGRSGRAACGLPEPDRIGRKYPHQVSGGQLQRLLAVMAMSCGPDHARVRRADHRDRRHHPGRGAGRVQGRDPAVGRRRDVRHPRSGGSRADGRSHHRALRRRDHGAGRHRPDPPRAAA